jgi:NADP-dependent 3-hydroxy acid dehydrogenase YdfG
MDGLANRVAVVTGASSGIGAAVAEALASAGMRVVLAARRKPQLEEVCARIRAAGGTAVPVVADMRVEAEVEGLIDAAVERFGALDALVNNAAVGFPRSVAEGRTEEWREMVETNLFGVFVACRAALRPMLAQGRGDLLFLTSVAGHQAWPYLAVYGACKAGVEAFARSLRAEVAPRGVRVSTLEVHNVAGTNFTASFDPEVLPAAFARWQELGLLGLESPPIPPEDVGQAALFLLSRPDPASVHHLCLHSRAG